MKKISKQNIFKHIKKAFKDFKYNRDIQIIVSNVEDRTPFISIAVKDSRLQLVPKGIQAKSTYDSFQMQNNLTDLQMTRFKTKIHKITDALENLPYFSETRVISLNPKSLKMKKINSKVMKILKKHEITSPAHLHLTYYRDVPVFRKIILKFLNELVITIEKDSIKDNTETEQAQQVLMMANIKQDHLQKIKPELNKLIEKIVKRGVRSQVKDVDYKIDVVNETIEDFNPYV